MSKRNYNESALKHTAVSTALYTVSRSAINPQHACAARVKVVAVSACLCVCVCVCVCVCPLSHISLLRLLFVLKTLLRTQRATKVKIFVAFPLKPCRSRATTLPALYG